MIRRLVLAVFALASVAAAQNVLKPEWASTTSSGSIGVAGTDCSTPACVWIVAPPNVTTVSVQLTGTFSATLRFEESVDGSTWIAIAADGAASSTTAAGIYTFSTHGAQFLRVRCSAYTSGSVGVTATVVTGTGVVGATGAAGAPGAAGPAYGNVQQYGAGGNTTLALTIAAAGAGGTALIPAGSAITLASAVTISQAGLTLRCEAGTTMTKSGNFDMINVTGSGVTVDGCALDGAQAGGNTGRGIKVTGGAAGVTLKNLTITNTNTSAIYISNASNVNVYGFKISGSQSSGAINVDGTGTNINIHDGYCDGSTEASFHKCVQAHATSAGNSIVGLRVSGVQMINGEGSCVEVGRFGGDLVQNVVVTGNTCDQATLVANGGKGAFGGYGGYSFDSAFDVTVANNVYRNLTATSTDNPGLELIGTRYNVTGNVITGSYATMNRLVDSVFANNTITQTFTDKVPLYVEIQPGSTSQPPVTARNLIKGNTFSLVNGGVDGVYQFCNTGTTGDGVSFCTDNVYEGNVVYDVAGTATGGAFRIGAVKGTSNSASYKGNKIVNWGGNCYTLSTNSTGSRFEDNLEGCATLGSTVATNASYYRGTKAAWTIGDAITISGGNLTFAALATPTAPTLVTATTGGTLAASTSYCYRIAAINANGTTVPSTETCATTSSGSTNSMYVYWPRVLGATGYKVYGRATAAELLMTATALAYNVNTFTDTGSVTPSGALPAANTTLGSLAGVGYIDFPAGSAPVNPAANTFRVYGDSGATALICLTSTGASCVYAPGTDILSGDIPPIDLGHTGTNGGITGTLSITQLNSTGATTGQVPQYNGSTIAWATLAATGNMVETVVLSDPTGGATCTTAGIDVQFSTASNTWWACGGDAKWYKLLASQNSGSALLAMQNSSGLPIAPVSGLANLYTTSTSVMQTQNSSNAIASTGVVPTDCTSTGLLQKINTDGTVGCAAAGAVSFGTVSGGSNTTAAMTVGTGASLGPAGTGTVKATSVVDSAQLPVLDATAVGSAVDYLTATNAATANPATVKLGAKGSDSNVNVEVDSKGTGVVQFNGTAAKVDASGNVTVQNLNINGSCTGCGAGGATGNQNFRTVGMTFDGGGSALSATTRCRLVNAAGTISGVSIVADQSGSATVDIKTVAYASYTGPASASSITAAAIPALSSAVKYQDTTLTGWTTSLSANTVVCFALTAPTTVTWLDVNFKYTAN